MNVLPISCGLVILALTAIGQTPPRLEPSPQAKAILDKTGQFYSWIPAKRNYNAVYSLTAEEKEILLKHFREDQRVFEDWLQKEEEWERLRAMRPMGVGKEIETARTMLGDPELIHEWLREAKEGDLGGVKFRDAINGLAAAAQPDTMLQLAPLMLVEEPHVVERVNDALTIQPRSYSVCSAMFGIVANSPAFEGKTRKWAQDNAKITAVPRMTMFQKWWKENEEHFEKGDYKAVKPGEELYAPIFEAMRAENEAMGALFEARRQGKETAQAAALPPPPVEQPPPVPPRTIGTTAAEGYYGYAAAGALLVLLATGIWFYSRPARA